MARPQRSHTLLWTVAVAIPVAAYVWIDCQTEKLCDHIERVGGVPARIGSVDADLTGRIRLSNVALGTQMSARGIEASVAARSIVAGDFGADEIRVASPRLLVRVDHNGESDLAQIVRRFGKTHHKSQGSTRLRRISVRSGAFIARVPGLGELSATDVDLIPNAGGVRIVTGPVKVATDLSGGHGELEFTRSAADIALPQITLGRVLAVMGRGRVNVEGQTIAVHDVVVGKLGAQPTFEVRATIDDAGIPRAILASIGLAAGHPDSTGAATSDITANRNHHLSIRVRGTHIPLRPFAPFLPRAIGVVDARASGMLTVRHIAPTAGSPETHVEVDGTVERASLDHQAIGPQPIAIGGSIRGTFVWSAETLVANQVQVGIGASRWTVSGHWSRLQPVSGQLDVALEQASCSELLRSLPIEIRGALDGLTMTGSFGGSVRVAVDLGAAMGDGVSLATDISNRCVVTAEATAADPTVLVSQSDHVFADGSRAQVGPGTPTWTELQHLPSHVVAAFVSAEDARFYNHRGFDPVQIGKSLEIDLRDRKLTRGGSTISQQLVKNSFLTHRRSLDRKIQEAILTWRLEAKLRKAQILERYLNVIELGPHVFGIHAAARHWFGKSPHELGVREAALLAALTSEPRSMSRRMKLASGLDQDSAERVDTVLVAMFRDGAIDRSTLDLARKARLSLSSIALAASP